VKKEISKQSRQELTDAIRERYRKASKQEKARILDEFVSLTGYQRKHAIRVLGSNGEHSTVERPVGKRIYDEAVKEALIVLWEASDRICGKRLKAPEVLYWLSEEPDATAKLLFERLMIKYPDKFNSGQLRTLQRRLRNSVT
jgi:hypothetical protein